MKAVTLGALLMSLLIILGAFGLFSPHLPGIASVIAVDVTVSALVGWAYLAWCWCTWSDH